VLPVLAALLLAVPGSHPDSLSRTRIRVEGNAAEVELRFQALSLIEVKPELDLRPDGRLDQAELAAGGEAISAYLLASLRLHQVLPAGEAPLPGKLASIREETEPAGGPADLPWLKASLLFTGESELELLVVESQLFHETNPWHKDLCSLSWNGAQEVPHVFEGAESRWLFEPAHVRRPTVFATFVRLGVEHILTGYDHLAFLLALLVASRRVRTLVAVVTAFTLAHSITLAAAALGWVDLPARFIELAIALSIAYVGCENLLRREPRNPWFEAFAFGLLHGLGFAGFLGDALAGEPLILTALVGFNLGVELGQLAVVLACVALFFLLFLRWHRARRQSADPSGLAPRAFRLAVSAAVALSGFYWFLERAGWIA
jgi:hydrogenase/urease accessory protein HupE